jgi:hypothetical protein
MDFAYSPKVEELRENLLDFMDAWVYPNEDDLLAAGRRQGERHFAPAHHGGAASRRRAVAGCGTCSCPTRSGARG